MRGDASRGAAEIDGFSVAIDELERLQISLNDTAETHLRAGRAERHSDNVGAQSSGARGADRAGVPVPGWHDELDRRWTDQRASMISAHDEAARSLAQVARSYLAQDAHVADILSADTTGVQTPSRADRPGNPERPAGEGQRLSTSAAEITRLEHAVAVWAQRGAASDETVRLLSASLDNLAWRGPAATAFHDWMSLHIRRWVELARSAEAIAAHLVDDARHDDPHDAGPDVPELTTAPNRVPRPSDDFPAGPMPPPGPSGDGDHPAETEPEPDVHPRPPAHAPSRAPSLDQISPAHPDTFAEVSEPAPAPRASDGHDRTEPAAESADEVPGHDYRAVSPDSLVSGNQHPIPLPTAPDPARTQISDPQPGHDTLPLGPRHETAQREPSAPDPPAPPVGAVAGAAALARQDRAHYIVRDITMPPAATTPTTPPQPDAATPPAPRGTSNPATPDPGPLPQHPAPSWTAAARSTGTATPAPMPPGTDTTLIGADPHPAAGRIPQQRRSPGNAPIWVNLNPPGPPAWIDLTARPGLGFDGPGASDILRTAISELHQHTPTTLVIPNSHLIDLLHGSGETPVPRTTAAPNDRLHLVDHPYDGLRALLAHAENRPHHPAQTPSPRALIAPAPTTHSALNDLTTALDDARPHQAAALLQGQWPCGAHLTIDAAHHVTDHTSSATNSPDLTGARLHPTSPRELAATLARQNPPLADVHSGPGQDTSDGDPADSSTSDIDPRPRTRLALTVLGPVELRYRRTHEPGPAHADTTEEILTVPRLAGPARELLAYLAAHPDGATRETIIEAIWPRTTAGRTDTAFHTTISRLRKRIRDTTRDEQADPITVSNRRWRIDPATVTVDYWTLLESSTPTTDPTHRRRTYRTVAALYNGLFAHDITGEWAHTIREATRRRYLEIITDLSEIEIQHDPAAALELLERARNMEPFNESIYRSIMRIQLSDDKYQSARNTYELLKIHLDEIDAVPRPETDKVAQQALIN